MAKITERCYQATGVPCFICDYSPPRSGSLNLPAVERLPVDFISVAHNPGRSVRANSAMAAASLKQQTAQDVAFTVATRDMNHLALQSQLLGAQMLGLENVIVVGGDPFSDADAGRLTTNKDVRPTEVIASFAAMNDGVDFRGTRLQQPTDFCVGATVDLGKGVLGEARLAHRKVTAGAQFLITQPIFDPADAVGFENAYRETAGYPPPVPVFYGLQVTAQDGISFANVPGWVHDRLAAGGSGVEIAAELYGAFRAAGLHNIYLVPSIRRGGTRGYEAARQALERFSQS